MLRNNSTLCIAALEVVLYADSTPVLGISAIAPLPSFRSSLRPLFSPFSAIVLVLSSGTGIRD